MFLVLEIRWLARPKKHRSVQLHGVANYTMAAIMSLPTEYPIGVRVNPVYW